MLFIITTYKVKLQFHRAYLHEKKMETRRTDSLSHAHFLKFQKLDAHLLENYLQVRTLNLREANASVVKLVFRNSHSVVAALENFDRQDFFSELFF